ncbi:Outer membrane protein assembly factor BamA [Buchnera aphidicola (Cinara kochiana kochiana)]|uniref:Outer membrane protein assembly factor BamA n=1 Tax=Buchnera aphidicola (Cinara kochiana kochiana) TaxID=2518976 RepID=A0A451D5E9_9GAMM|nr:outer membrane protein assembly factor BamA [Buchnera aphidicola]VFP81071.1 Outer membrane protein assembly factor BamA [Buchnera aphidicola (Cinara kochiana kochiana)]
MLLKKIFFICCLFFSVSVSAVNMKHIKRISVCGVKHVSRDNILKTLQLNSFNDNTCINVSKIIALLLRTNYFMKIHTSRLNDTLILSVQEFPIITDISILGVNNKKLKYFNKLLNRFKVKKNKSFNIFNFNNFFLYLKKAYQLQGYFSIHCALKIVRYPDNTVQLKIIFKEEPISLISKIFIYGNKNFYKKKVLQDLNQHDNNLLWNFFDFNRCDYTTFKKSLRALYNFYIRHGYLDIKINIAKQHYSRDDKCIDLKININEGSRYYIKKIFIDEHKGLCSNKFVHDIQKYVLNAPYCESTISQLKKDFKNIFLKMGLLNTRILLHSELNKKNHTICLYILLDLKKQYFVNKINFSGNSFIDQKFLNIFIYNHKNDLFNINLIKKSCHDLFKTSLFNNIKVCVKKHLYSNDKVDIYYYFKKCDNTRNVSVSTSYENGRGVLLKFLLLEKNFLNAGNELCITVLKNIYDTNLKIHLLKPLRLLKNFFLKSNAFVNVMKERYIFPNTSTNKLFGFDTSCYTPKIKNKKFSVTCGYEKTKILLTSPHIVLLKYLSSFSKKFFLNSKIDNLIVNDFFVKYMFDFNNIKEKNFFKMGTHIKFLGKLTLPFSDNFYHKIFFSINQYVPLEKIYDITIHNFLEFGSGLTLGHHIFPFYENYKFYHKNTKSGFKDNSVGPIAIYYKNSNDHSANSKQNIVSHFYPSTDFIGGNMMVHANVELSSPKITILKKIFQIFQAGVFLDAINIWDTNWKNTISLYSIKESLTIGQPNYTYLSAGTFIRWYSIFGPITFTFAFPLHPHNISNYFLNRFSVNFL